MAQKKGYARDETKTYLVKGHLKVDDEVKHLMLPGEAVMYFADDIFFTNRRIIKHSTSKWAKLMHHFYSTYEDLDFRHLESIKAKNVINHWLLFSAILVFFMAPVASFLAAFPGLGGVGLFFLELAETLDVGGLFLIGIVLVISAMILRDRVVEFHGHGTVIKSKHFHDDELLKVRELQRIRLRQLDLDT